MTIRRNWSQQELNMLFHLSSKCPPAVIAEELSRSVTSVRKKMREYGLRYITREQWMEQRVQYFIFEDNVSQTTHKSSKTEDFESPVLDEFLAILMRMARVAKKKEKRIDVITFIETYRKIRIQG